MADAITPQREIQSIMLQNGVSYKWIADKLGTFCERIRYYVEFSGQDNDELYSRIMLLFERHGLVNNQNAACDAPVEPGLAADERIAEYLKRINAEIARDVRSSLLSPDERVKTRGRLKEIKEQFSKVFDDLIDLTSDEAGK